MIIIGHIYTFDVHSSAQPIIAHTDCALRGKKIEILTRVEWRAADVMTMINGALRSFYNFTFSER